MDDEVRPAPPPAELIALLRRINLQLRQRQELVEAQLAAMNGRLDEAHRQGRLDRLVLEGPVIERRADSFDMQGRSGRVLQAALAVPGGFGLVIWDDPDHGGIATDSLARVREIRRRLIPFETCEPAVQELLTPYAAELILKLLDQFELPAGA